MNCNSSHLIIMKLYVYIIWKSQACKNTEATYPCKRKLRPILVIKIPQKLQI
ncbi:hypothetical protein Hanom_Chr15g01405101 [Helianthus anomalus]